MDLKYQFTNSKREQTKFPYKCVRKACTAKMRLLAMNNVRKAWMIHTHQVKSSIRDRFVSHGCRRLYG